MRVIFDVDGTLIHSGAVDAEFYERAFFETFGARLPTTDWASYRNATDRGIVEEAAERLGLPLDRLGAMRERFVSALSALNEIEPVAGARTILRELELRGIKVGIATGGWEAAARAKLRAARVEASVPLVGSDDFARREDIVRAAIDRVGGAGETVYVGDGLWDIVAAKNLGIGFVGVDVLQDGRLGQPAVRDFSDVNGFVEVLRGI